MLRPNSFHSDIKRKMMQKMRMFNDMLDIIKERYGEMSELILEDYVHIKLKKAEGLYFTDIQFKAMEDLVRLPTQTVSYSYSNAA